ncbi:MAG TPA: ribosomal protein S18-alanine N-acetyltransferase [candidate division Zixibacteria bacterium]|nr:ribosomal protein S18-alanine N-acetyltransferase [candidate division Zixibacteria bacterium]
MPSKIIRVRAASKKDLSALVHLERIAFQKDAFKPRRIRYLLTDARSTVFVLEKNKEIIGAAYLLWHKNRANGRIYNIVVAPKSQGRGYGEKLLKECERACKRRRCSSISLEVRVDNKQAIAFYKKHGFEIVGRIPVYYEDGTAGFKMFKSLKTQ